MKPKQSEGRPIMIEALILVLIHIFLIGDRRKTKQRCSLGMRYVREESKAQVSSDLPSFQPNEQPGQSQMDACACIQHRHALNCPEKNSLTSAGELILGAAIGSRLEARTGPLL